VGTFDHLVFIAGEALHLGDLKSNAIGQAKQFFELRFWSAFVIAKYGSAGIRPGGSIILSNGIAGRRPWKGWAVAASIAGAVESLTRALAIELAPIRVNALCTGASATGFGDATPMSYREVLHDDIARALPLTAADDTGDASEAYLYLMREKFSTGRTILVDAGAALV
jgi:NAD(P)-dependent dehydrogenase (short-subunit alcohol dehydrogenase family)